MVNNVSARYDAPWRVLGFESGPPQVDVPEAVERYRSRSRQILKLWAQAPSHERHELREQQGALDEALATIAAVRVQAAWSQAGTPNLPFEVPFADRSSAELLESGAAQRLGSIVAFYEARSQRVTLVALFCDKYDRYVFVLRPGAAQPGNHLLACFPQGEVFEVTDGQSELPGLYMQWVWQILLRDGRAVPPTDWQPLDLDSGNARQALDAAARANAGDLTLHYTTQCPACLNTWQATFPVNCCSKAGCGQVLPDDAHVRTK